MKIHKIIEIIKDILFPVSCLGCGKEGSFVCNNCMKTLDCSGVFYCPICHVEARDGIVCSGCETALDRHVGVIQYIEDSLIGKVLHTFKYSYAEDVKDVLEILIEQFFLQYHIDVDIIIPVPLHKKRYVERGFNQAEIIARIVGKTLDMSVCNILKRTRHTKQQAKLNREERLENLTGAFSLKKDVDIRGKRILLVDDVLTTGSTMGECAKVLKDAGAREIVGFTIARG